MQITRREKRLLLLSATLAGIWLFYGYILKPAQDRLRTLERIIPEKQAALIQLVSLGKQYQHLRQQSTQDRQQLVEQPVDFVLLTFLEKTAQQCSLTSAAMEEQPIPPDSDVMETTVSMDLQEISFTQLVHFLSALRRCPAAIGIKSLHIIRNDTDGRLDVTVVISHLKVPVPRQND